MSASRQWYVFYKQLKIPVDMITRCKDSPKCANCKDKDTMEHAMRDNEASQRYVIVQVLALERYTVAEVVADVRMDNFIDKYWKELLVDKPISDSIEVYDFNCTCNDEVNPALVLQTPINLTIFVNMTDTTEAMRVMTTTLLEDYDTTKPLLIMPDAVVMIPSSKSSRK